MTRTSFWPGAILIVLSSTGFSRCSSNQSGDLAAQKFGDLNHALAARGPAATAAIDRDCGLTRQQPPSQLRRRPYIQRLSESSLDIVWTQSAPAAAPEVTISRPDGTPVARAAAVVDTSARPIGSALQWSASLSGLEPATPYCYEVTSGTTLLDRGGFRSAPRAGAGAPVRFVALGDSGHGGADQRAVLEQIRSVPFDLMVHTGDIAYSSGTRGEFQRNFFDVYADLLGLFPMFPASGNHEYETEDAAPYREVFVLPDNGGPGGRERWYSYDFGDVHFVALDTERTGPEQAAWLDADLGATRLPWTVVYLHKPAYSSGEHGGDSGVQQHFVPVFEKHAVPLVLAGHDHHYERTVPQNGVTYVVTGGGGRGTRHSGASPFTAFSESVCHLVYVTVQGDELTLHAIDGVGREFDSLLLRR
jgi:acid phosphatase type 7